MCCDTDDRAGIIAVEALPASLEWKGEVLPLEPVDELSVLTVCDNIMDMLQLVFAFVNAPLFATFLLGMFWRRTTGHGAFFGLITGTLVAAVHDGLTLPHGAVPGIKGAYLGAALHIYPSEMAQNFWTAIFAWSACFVTTVVISLLTARRKSDDELSGLVYALTPRIIDRDLVWYKRPGTLAVIVLALVVVLNIIFW